MVAVRFGGRRGRRPWPSVCDLAEGHGASVVRCGVEQADCRTVSAGRRRTGPRAVFTWGHAPLRQVEGPTIRALALCVRLLTLSIAPGGFPC